MREKQSLLFRVWCGTQCKIFGLSNFRWEKSQLALLNSLAVCQWYLRKVYVEVSLRAYWNVRVSFMQHLCDLLSKILPCHRYDMLEPFCLHLRYMIDVFSKSITISTMWISRENSLIRYDAVASTSSGWPLNYEVWVPGTPYIAE